MRQISLVLSGDAQRIENDQALAYYQGYMSGVFSQPYGKNKFPKYGDLAPWKKSVNRMASKPDDYDKKLERMMMFFTQSVGGEVH